MDNRDVRGLEEVSNTVNLVNFLLFYKMSIFKIIIASRIIQELDYIIKYFTILI